MEAPARGAGARSGSRFSHRPPGDKVALGETVRRVLSASSTPRVVWGLVLAALAALLLRQLGARCLSSSRAFPQDRENCHVDGNVFVFFDGSAPVTLCNLYRH